MWVRMCSDALFLFYFVFQPIDMDLTKVVAPAAVFDAIGHIFSNISVVALYWSSITSCRGIASFYKSILCNMVQLVSSWGCISVAVLEQRHSYACEKVTTQTICVGLKYVASYVNKRYLASSWH